MLVSLEGVLDLVGLVKDHRGHQDNHRDGEPGAEAQAGDGSDNHDSDGGEATEDDGDLQEREVEVRHEHQGGEAGDHTRGDDASREEDAAGVPLRGKDDVTDEGDEDQGFQDDVQTQTSILGTTRGSVEGQRLGHGGGAPEGEHDEQDAPSAQRADHGAEASEYREGDTAALVEADEEDRQQGREGGKADGHEAVGTTEEGSAVGGRGVSDDEGIGFHKSNHSPFPGQSSQWGYFRLSRNKGGTQACQSRQQH